MGKFDSAETFVKALSTMRAERTGEEAAPEQEQAQPQTEEQPIVDPTQEEGAPQTPEEDIPAEEAKQRDRYKEDATPNVNDKISHRDWVEQTNEVLEKLRIELDVSDPSVAEAIYEDLADFMHIANISERHKAFSELLNGFEPAEGWDRFIMRLQASASGFDPDFIYRYKLYELMDDFQAENGNPDLSSIIDTRTERLQVHVVAAHARNTGKL